MTEQKYKVVVNAKDGENGIEIVGGKFDGVIYTYGEVQFKDCLLYTSTLPTILPV